MNSFKNYFNLRTLMLLVLASALSFGTVSCKGKKEAQQKAIAHQQKVNKAKKTLNNLLADNTKSSAELERELNKLKALNLDEQDVTDLIKRVEDKIEKKRAEEEKLINAKKIDEEAKLALNEQLDLNFAEIISASNSKKFSVANQKIEETINLFTSKDAVVLIIVYKDNVDVDYDEPTTIEKYLNYLKDQKSYNKKVETFKLAPSGKIEELELNNK